MKRAGKVFLALALVLAMLWTSTGTSNVPGVLAENVASMQSAKDNKEAVKATTEEGLGFTGSGEGIACQAVVLLDTFENVSYTAVSADADGNVIDERPCSSCGGCTGCPKA